MTTDAVDRPWLLRALELAGNALGNTAPNPPVGAVIVRDGAVLGEGFTRPAGREHAEVVALADCVQRGNDPRGATLYVTLEPCCHHGRTPPCTDALLAAGLSRVVVGVLDPFPAMRGRSLEILRAAGVRVTLGVEADAAERRILGFARAVGFGLPEVTCKAAMSADGHIATASGESQWITGALARADGHLLRARHDALVIGVGTALADDPQLTTRLIEGALPDRSDALHAVPVVLDTELRVPAQARLFQGPKAALILCADDAPVRALPGEVIRVPRGEGGHVDPEAALRVLAARGLHRVLVEGGGQIHRALIRDGLVDTLHLYVAALVVPGGRPWVAGPPIEALSEATSMQLTSTETLGSDVKLTYRLAHRLAPDPLVALREGLAALRDEQTPPGSAR